MNELFPFFRYFFSFLYGAAQARPGEWKPPQAGLLPRFFCLLVVICGKSLIPLPPPRHPFLVCVWLSLLCLALFAPPPPRPALYRCRPFFRLSTQIITMLLEDSRRGGGGVGTFSSCHVRRRDLINSLTQEGDATFTYLQSWVESTSQGDFGVVNIHSGKRRFESSLEAQGYGSGA